MFKRNIVTFLYCIIFPLLIGIILIAIPEFSSIPGNSELLLRIVRVWVTICLMLAYVSTGLSFMPHLESSPIALSFSTQGRFYTLRDGYGQSRVDRNIFPLYFSSAVLISCTFASLVIFWAILIFVRLSASLSITIAIVNFLMLLLPNIFLYKQILKVLYVDES